MAGIKESKIKIVILTILAFVVAAIFLFPILWLLSSSFSRCSVGSRPSSSHIRRDCVRVSSAAAA